MLMEPQQASSAQLPVLWINFKSDLIICIAQFHFLDKSVKRKSIRSQRGEGNVMRRLGSAYTF